MSFSITVQKIHLPEPMPSNPDEIDAWIDRENQYSIFDAPLASDGDMWDYWAKPSKDLGYGLFYIIYDQGFESSDTEELSALKQEAENIRSNWGTIKTDAAQFLLLQERYDYLSEGIKLALDNGYELLIT